MLQDCPNIKINASHATCILLKLLPPALNKQLSDYHRIFAGITWADILRGIPYRMAQIFDGGKF